MSLETSGKKIDSIDVKISYRIIQLFSAGLYSSPNKAFEELVCNSYDAFAQRVCVHVPSDLSVPDAHIWVCDDGESMNQDGLKDLWRIGESLKRNDPGRDDKRLQIGRFGIGKLSTYILANKLTYICKHSGRYLAVTMNYSDIPDDDKPLTLDQRELTQDEAKNIIDPYLAKHGVHFLKFDLWGVDSLDSWTFSIMTELKPKAAEIKEGRLKWILKTALPLNPGFRLFYNGTEISSSKVDRPITKTWVIGKDDVTAEEKVKEAVVRADNGKHFVDFPNLKSVHGQFELYEDSLVDSSKSSHVGRSHGIFLMVRGRLINLDDPLLGMDAFSHGAFNRSRIVIHADELDDNLTSTREAIKDSDPLNQLKDYLKKKFNNEIKKFYFQQEDLKQQEQNTSFRLAKTSLTVSRRPLLVVARKSFSKEIAGDMWLIALPQDLNSNEQASFLGELEAELTGEGGIVRSVEWEIMDTHDPIARLDLLDRVLKINLMHPYVANFSDVVKSKLVFEFIAITEVLTEAHLYELGLDESKIREIMKRRDTTLRELIYSDRLSAPLVAGMVKDSLSDSTGLELAVYRAFQAMGFDTTKIGGKGTPDGKADAVLGYSSSDTNESYSLVYDAKSTGKKKIQASTAKFSACNRHKTNYNANYSVVVAIGFEGADSPESAINHEAKQQQVTAMMASDLMRLLLLTAPKQLGLKKMRSLFENCHTPLEVKAWIDKLDQEEVRRGPIKELLEVIYELQKNDTEPAELANVRGELHRRTPQRYSKDDIRQLIQSLKTFIPGFISLEGERVGIQATPDSILDKINTVTDSDIPIEMQELYSSAFGFSLSKNNE